MVTGERVSRTPELRLVSREQREGVLALNLSYAFLDHASSQSDEQYQQANRIYNAVRDSVINRTLLQVLPPNYQSFTNVEQTSYRKILLDEGNRVYQELRAREQDKLPANTQGDVDVAREILARTKAKEVTNPTHVVYEGLQSIEDDSRRERIVMAMTKVDADYYAAQLVLNIVGEDSSMREVVLRELWKPMQALQHVVSEWEEQPERAINFDFPAEQNANNEGVTVLMNSLETYIQASGVLAALNVKTRKQLVGQVSNAEDRELLERWVRAYQKGGKIPHTKVALGIVSQVAYILIDKNNLTLEQLDNFLTRMDKRVAQALRREIRDKLIKTESELTAALQYDPDLRDTQRDERVQGLDTQAARARKLYDALLAHWRKNHHRDRSTIAEEESIPTKIGEKSNGVAYNERRSRYDQQLGMIKAAMMNELTPQQRSFVQNIETQVGQGNIGYVFALDELRNLTWFISQQRQNEGKIALTAQQTMVTSRPQGGATDFLRMASDPSQQNWGIDVAEQERLLPYTTQDLQALTPELFLAGLQFLRRNGNDSLAIRLERDWPQAYYVMVPWQEPITPAFDDNSRVLLTRAGDNYSRLESIRDAAALHEEMARLQTGGEVGQQVASWLEKRWQNLQALRDRGTSTLNQGFRVDEGGTTTGQQSLEHPAVRQDAVAGGQASKNTQILPETTQQLTVPTPAVPEATIESQELLNTLGFDRGLVDKITARQEFLNINDLAQLDVQFLNGLQRMIPNDKNAQLAIYGAVMRHRVEGAVDWNTIDIGLSANDKDSPAVQELIHEYMRLYGGFPEKVLQVVASMSATQRKSQTDSLSASVFPQGNSMDIGQSHPVGGEGVESNDIPEAKTAPLPIPLGILSELPQEQREQVFEQFDAFMQREGSLTQLEGQERLNFMNLARTIFMTADDIVSRAGREANLETFADHDFVRQLLRRFSNGEPIDEDIKLFKDYLQKVIDHVRGNNGADFLL